MKKIKIQATAFIAACAGVFLPLITTPFFEGIRQKFTREEPQEYSETLSPKKVSHVTLEPGQRKSTVTIVPWNQPYVKLNAYVSYQNKERDEQPYRITSSDSNVKIATTTQESHNGITYKLWVPQSATVSVEEAGECDVTLERVTAQTHVATQSGSVEAHSVTDSLTITAPRGAAWVELNHLSSDAQLMVTAGKNIVLNVTPHLNALLDAHVSSARGEITSTLPITLEPFTITLNKKHWNLARKHIRGTIGSPTQTAPVTLESHSGNIAIDTVRH